MSHQFQVRVLAHNQSLSSERTVTRLAVEIADLLVQRMIAERISRKLIRMLPPDSPFPVAKFYAETGCYLPATLPSANVGNTKFVPPKSALESVSTIPRLRSLPRYREVFGDHQLLISLSILEPCPDALNG